MQHILVIALGGSLGAVSRYLISKNIYRVFPHLFPLGTLVVNTTGAFIIGFLYSLFENTIVSDDVKAFLTIGFLGAYTTFSTYSLETVNFIRDGEIRLGLLNIFLNNIACLLMVVAGFISARVILKLAR